MIQLLFIPLLQLLDTLHLPSFVTMMHVMAIHPWTIEPTSPSDNIPHSPQMPHTSSRMVF